MTPCVIKHMPSGYLVLHSTNELQIQCNLMYLMMEVPQESSWSKAGARRGGGWGGGLHPDLSPCLWYEACWNHEMCIVSVRHTIK